MSSRNDALRNDALIQDLVLYEVSKGNTKPLVEADLNTIQHRFSEYKSLIRRKEFTYDELADRIFSKYGIVTPLVKIPPVQSHAVHHEIDQANVDEFMETIHKILGAEKKVQKEPEKPYKWYQKIRDKLGVFLARFSINI